MTFLNKIKTRIVDYYSGGVGTLNIRKHLDSLVSEDRDYALKHLPNHMVEAGRCEQLYQWLADFDFIAAKVDHLEINIQELIADYDLALNADVLVWGEQQKALRLIQGALRLAAHILDEDKVQISGQLLGRLQHFEHPDIQRLLEKVKHDTTYHYLCPQTTSLAPPGGHLFRTLIGHTDSVNAVAITTDGKQVISASSDKTLIVWNWENGNKRFILKGHSAPVKAVTITPDNKRVISASLDETIKVWDLDNGQELRTLNNYNPLANKIAVTTDALVISPSLSKLTLWDLDADEELPIIEDSYREPLTNDAPKLHSCSIAITSNRQWAISSSFYSYWVWSTEAPELAHKQWHNSVKLWDLKIKEERFYFSEELGNLFKIMAITPDGLRVICGSSDSRIEVFDLQTEREPIQNKFKDWIWRYFGDQSEYKFLKPIFLLNGHKDSIETLAVTPDSKRLISGSKDKTLKVWDLQTKTRIFNLTGHSDRVNAVGISPDGQWAISGSSDCTLKVWSLATEEQEFTFYGHRDSVNTLAITPDGKQLISGSKEGKFIVWDLDTKKILYSVPNQKISVNNLGLTPDAKQLIYSDRNGNIKIWDLKNRQPVVSKIRNAQLAQSFVVSPNGKSLIVLRKDGYCRFIPLGSDQSDFKNIPDLFIKLKIENDSFQINAENKTVTVSSSQQEKKILIDRGNQWILALLTTMFYSYIISSKDQDKDLWIMIIDIVIATILCFLPVPLLTLFNYQEKLTLFIVFILYIIYFIIVLVLSDQLTESQGDNNINCMAITPDSDRLIFAASDSNIKIFNLESREQLSDLIGHRDSVETVAVTPDGKFIVSGSADRTIKVWSLETHEQLFTLIGHSDTVNNVVITPDSKLIISTSCDNTLKVWDLQTGKVTATFTGESRVNSCAVAPDGLTIVAGESSGRLHFLRLENVN